MILSLKTGNVLTNGESNSFLDTSILIDFYRKKNKSKTTFYSLGEKYFLFALSVITEYEISIGSTSEQDQYWDDFFYVKEDNFNMHFCHIYWARFTRCKIKYGFHSDD